MGDEAARAGRVRRGEARCGDHVRDRQREPASKDLATDLATTFGAREPFDTAIGPVKPRGALNGLIVRRGYIVAEWGETDRVDMTFSVTKSFLSTVVGQACRKD